MAFRRLLQLYPAIQSRIHADNAIVNSDPEQMVMVSGDGPSKRKAREMVKILTNNVFWQKIAL
jgi:hypothetical protein